MSAFAVLRMMTIAAGAAAVASGASAQGSAAAPAAETFALPFAAVPQTIHGVKCEARPGNAQDAPTLRCDPDKIMEQPSIFVSVADWKARPTRAELIAHTREAFHGRAIFNVIREENFAPPSDLDAVGFRGLYQTDLGNRYVWTVLSKGKMVRVIATVFAPTDFAAMTRDIEQKIFGVPAFWAAAAKDK